MAGSKRSALNDPPRLVLGLNSGPPIGRQLREYREAAGLSQCQLAERLGINQSVLCRFEGREDVLLSSADAYIHALGGQLHVSVSLPGTASEPEAAVELEGDEQPDLPFFTEPPTSPPPDQFVFSIKPGYAEDILRGRKTVELRRRFRQAVAAPTSALIYTTSPTMALTGVAEISHVDRMAIEDLWTTCNVRACVSRDDFDRYFSGLEEGFAIHLVGARRLKRNIQLPELRTLYNFEPPQSYTIASPRLRDAVHAELA